MITQGDTKDTKELFLLESSVFSDDDYPLSRASFYYHLKYNELFIYKEKGKIVGYILWLKRKNSYRLYSLCISKDHRSKGIAQKLMEYSFLVLQSSKFTLEVKTTNQAAIALYRKNGFKIQKTLNGFYSNNIDGYSMEKG